MPIKVKPKPSRIQWHTSSHAVLGQQYTAYELVRGAQVRRYQENSFFARKKNNSLGDQNDQNKELQCALFQAVDSEILAMRSEIYYIK